ncbi:uncharacterized protein [Rutidosis leptorrhynchoides]|uniref:uncharacterized protein n=1 Tax=Rutidosis leptorrhynchoides TaxID=125765 RepID=UPI003A9A3C73
MGDLNSVRIWDDHCGSEFCVQDTWVLNDFIENNSLYEVSLGGLHFTWRNKAGSKLSKIDRFFISNNVLNVIEDLKGSVLDRGYSDHSPILIFQEKVDFGPTYFKIFESWFARHDFDSTVRKAWDIINRDKELDIVAKFRLMKGHLKSWISSSRSNEASRYKEIVKKINDIDYLIDAGTAGADVISSRISLVAERDELSKLEDIDSFQKASFEWDIEGDENSKFFHVSLKIKRHSKQIQGQLFDEAWIDDLNLDDVEINNAVWDCGSSRAPGPDGISFRFIKYFWDIFQFDICKDVRRYFSSCIMPRSANSAFFSLIPKVTNLILVTDFRPISLVGFFYKIVTKILTNRLLVVIDKIISPIQTTFISGHQFLDGPLMLSEIITWIKKSNKKILLFKVDFEKAYDYVNWDYLMFMLSSFGFGPKWCAWIRGCLHSAKASVLVNGSTTREFQIKRGVESAEIISYAAAAGARVGSFPTTYVGLPIGSNMKLTSSWDSLVVSDGLLPIDTFKMKVGNGCSIRFLHDLWYGNSTLSSRFNRLYPLDINKLDSIADKRLDGAWHWTWTRGDIGSRNRQILFALQDELGDCLLDDKSDQWCCLILWNLSAKGIEINSVVCPLCNNGIETQGHLFFDCDMAKELWLRVRVWLDCALPTCSSWDTFITWLEGVRLQPLFKDRIVVVVTTFLWAIWRFRNGVVFNNSFCTESSLFDIIRLLSFRWIKHRGHLISNWNSWLSMPL